MKNNNFIKTDVPNSIEPEPHLSVTKTGIATKIGKNLKTFIYIAGLAGIGIFMNSCVAGYVPTEPTYVQNVRPAQPSNLHIWIDGDWVYNRQSRNYVQNTGYWERPRQNQVYVSGRWQSGSHGKYWERGRWENNRRQSNRNNR
jgi:hypothetical protein